MVGPNVNLLSMSSVSLGSEAASAVVRTASCHFVDVLPKGWVSFHILIYFVVTYLVSQFISVEFLAILVVILEFFKLKSHLVWSDSVLFELYDCFHVVNTTVNWLDVPSWGGIYGVVAARDYRIVPWVLILAHIILHLWEFKNLIEVCHSQEFLIIVFSSWLMMALRDIDIDTLCWVDWYIERAGLWLASEVCSQALLFVRSITSSILHYFCYTSFLEDFVSVSTHLAKIWNFNDIFSPCHSYKLLFFIIFNSYGDDFDISVFELLGVLSIWSLLSLSFTISDEYYDLSIISSPAAILEQFICFIVTFSRPGSSCSVVCRFNIWNDFVDIGSQFCFNQSWWWKLNEPHS